MTIDEFWNQSPPAFLRYVVCRPPDDWPVKGTRQNNVAALRLDYVRRGLVTFFDEYVASKAPGEDYVIPDAVIAARRAPILFEETPEAETVKPVGGIWKCEKCKAAPPRYKDYPNNYKWKTEKGFLGHKCLG